MAGSRRRVFRGTFDADAVHLAERVSAPSRLCRAHLANSAQHRPTHWRRELPDEPPNHPCSQLRLVSRNQQNHHARVARPSPLAIRRERVVGLRPGSASCLESAVQAPLVDRRGDARARRHLPTLQPQGRLPGGLSSPGTGTVLRETGQSNEPRVRSGLRRQMPGSELGADAARICPRRRKRGDHGFDHGRNGLGGHAMGRPHGQDSRLLSGCCGRDRPCGTDTGSTTMIEFTTHRRSNHQQEETRCA